MIYKRIIKPILFVFSPETAHHLVFTILALICKIPGALFLLRFLYGRQRPEEAVEIAGLRFPNAVGLAAGFDKDARLFRELGALGFGFVEVGTVTPVGQPGNPQPRLFRLPADEALINRMGFNNDGVEAMIKRLKFRRDGLIIGGNIGKNKVTANEQASSDYNQCFTALFDYVDYFVVNVSSPNTPGLRELQEKEPLKRLLAGLQQLNAELSVSKRLKIKPIFLKIAPDLSEHELDDIVEVVLETRLAGVIATNTTLNRSNLKTAESELTTIGAGGLSGRPLATRSTEIIRYLSLKSGGKFAIVGVGGIHDPEEALRKMEAGASLVQLYTGFIYEGPSLVKKIRKAIRLRQK